MAPLIRVPAGRSIRREGTKFVDAQPQQGTIELELVDDLLEFRWINNSTGITEDQLMLVTGISTFTEVAQDESRRTYVLDFSGSSDKHFFWLQRANLETELQNVADLNGFMRVDDYTKGSDPIAGPPARTAAASSVAHVESAGQSATHKDTVKLLVQWTRGGVLQPFQTDESLVDLVKKDDVATSLAGKPELVQLLPRDVVPSTPTAETISSALESSQFTGAIDSLDAALKSGPLPADSLSDTDLAEGDGRDYKAFLGALVGLKLTAGDNSGGEAMETD